MRGVGGPLLCIGDLLSDIGDSSEPDPDVRCSSISIPTHTSQIFDLPKLFQKNYENLNEALARSDHSWAALTLKLCSAVETANKLVQSTNSNVTLLSVKVGELEQVVKRGDAAVADARGIISALSQKEETRSSSQKLEYWNLS